MKFGIPKKNSATNYDVSWYLTQGEFVQDYGAKADAAHGIDDTTAIQNAVNAAVAKGKAAVIFPPGDCLISAEITVLTQCNIVFVGFGGRVSRIIQSSAGQCGIRVLFPSNDQQYTARVYNLGVIAKTSACGTAISIGYTGVAAGSTETQDGCEVKGCNISNYGTGYSQTGYWNGGITMNNSWHFRISDCVVIGDLVNARHGNGIWVNGMNIGSWINNIQVAFWSVGLLFSAITNTDYDIEGVYMSGFNFLSCDTMISGAGDGIAPYMGPVALSNAVFDNGFVVSGTPVCIKLVNCVNWNITGCDFLNGYSAGYCIDMQNTTGCTIVGNTFWVGPTGIRLVSSNDNVITGNNVNVVSTFVNADAGSSGNRVTSNTYSSGGTANIDSGTNSIGEITQLLPVVNMTGGVQEEYISVDITSARLGRKPTATMGSCSTAQLIVSYDFDDGANSKTNARFRVWKPDGSNIPSGLQKYSILVNP